MSYAKIGWLLVLLLSPLSSGYSLSYKKKSCSNFERDWKHWKIYCPNETNTEFSLELHTADLAITKYGNVDCNDANSWWSDFEVEPGESLYEIRVLKIRGCPLPDVTFAEIVRRLGLRNVIDVTFSSHMNLNSSMRYRHLLNFGTIEDLTLRFNGFTELPSDLLRDVTRIRRVDLSHNKITTLPFDMFEGLMNLSIINLNYNRIKIIDWRVFRDSRSLRTLYLRRNLLTTLGNRIFEDAVLSHLDLSQNRLETLPNRVFESTKQLTLYISANEFALLPEELFHGVSMKHIIMSNNHRNSMTLPNHFLSNLTQLETVVLARNALTVLPETIFWGDIQLQHVDLRGNALFSIPADIFRDSKKLDSLDLSENELDSLSENLFRGLSKLREINLERNNLTSISEKLFSGLSSLAELNLGFNSIATIHQAAFEDLLSLRVVSLSHNFINLLGNFYVGRRRLRIFASLQNISLDHNHLDGKFDFNIHLRDMPANLRFVNLSHNYIRRITLWKTTAGSQNVVYDFRHNRLSSVFVRGNSRRRIDILIDNNTFFCDCSLYDILVNLEENGHTQSENNIRVIPGRAVCRYPSWMASVYVADVRLETFTCRPYNDERYVYCAEKCDCWWIPHTTTRLVNCTSRNLEKVPQQLIEFLDDKDEKEDPVPGQYVHGTIQWFHWQRSPVQLDLAGNSLVEIPTLNVSVYKYVDTLVLSRNNISKLSFDVLPPRLKVLHLDHNELERFDRVAWNALINSATLKKLNFEGNPWSCDSDTRRALESMENKLGANLRCPTKKCLDYRNLSNNEKTSPLYISYTIF